MARSSSSRSGNRGGSRGGRRGRGSFFGALFSIAFFLLMVASSVALVATLIAPYFASTHGWVFPFVGLIAPAIYVFAAALALFFVVRWQWKMALPLVVLLALGASRVPLFVKVPLTKDYGLDSYKGCVKMMSYNIRGVMNENWQPSADQVAEYVDREKPDVICFQEYNGAVGGSKGSLPRQLRRYNIATYGEMAIYSRYPIVGKGDVFRYADTLGGRSMYADLLVGSDTIRVINNHLNSNSIDDSDRAYLRPTTVLKDAQRKHRLGSIVRSFGNGSAERTAQVRVIRACMESSPYRYVVCGDFNDAPISFTYYELARGMRDAFVERGDGYSYTYRGFGNLLRIDYILTSDGVEPRSYFVDRAQIMSDHLPVTSHLKIEKR